MTNSAETERPKSLWVSDCGRFAVFEMHPQLKGIPRWPNRSSIGLAHSEFIGLARAGEDPRGRPVDLASSTKGWYALYRVQDLPFQLGKGPQSTAAEAPSVWNGRCMRCGKGTYQGFMALEHEGGGCP